MPSAATIMSLSEPRAADERSACTASSPSGSTRSSRWVSIATTSRRPSGNQPRPDGSSSSTRTTVSAVPSSAVEMTRWSCMSLHQRRPSCQRGPSVNTRSSSTVRTVGRRHPRTLPVLCNVDQMNKPVSAARVAELAGDSLPDPAAIPAAAFDLVAATRELTAAVVMTDVDADVRAQAVAELEAITERLRAAQRADAMFLSRHADGRVESLTQAGSGRLNPQAPPIEWIHRPKEPPPGTPPTPVEVHARCTFGPAAQRFARARVRRCARVRARRGARHRRAGVGRDGHDGVAHHVVEGRDAVRRAGRHPRPVHRAGGSQELHVG